MEIKNLNLKKYKNEILFIPLGGSGEIGLNCNLYHFKGKWIVVDCGVGFVKTVPGVNIIIPDTALLKKLKDDILGIFITHIHEDHLGALQYVWQDLQIPIYTSRFTKYFLFEKLKECKFFNELVINEFNEGDIIKLDPFEIECVNLTHSTPEMNALIIKTENGNLLHTGDWKFDDGPVVGNKSNIKRLKQLGSKKEILATICDSTNIFSLDEEGSESELYNSFYNIVKDKKGLVVFTMFASNIARITTIVKLAKKLGKQIVVIGSSLFRLIKVAKMVGLIEEGTEFLTEDSVKDMKKRNFFVLATGCQGEPFAAMEKLASDSVKSIHLKEDDCVIFSSSIIPGNEKDLAYLHNKLAEKDVEVITERTHFVHVSGHYTVSDLKKFYSFVKPKIAIAVHGEAVHLLEHQKIAKECGIKNTFKSKNGAIVKIGENGVEKLNQIDVKVLFVDGKRLLTIKDDIIRTRKKLEDVGVIFINFLINNKYKILQDPIVTAPGGYNLSTDNITREIFVEDIVDNYNKAIKQINEIKSTNKKKFSTEEEMKIFLDQKIRTTVNKIYEIDIGKKPYMEIIFTKIKENKVPNIIEN